MHENRSNWWKFKAKSTRQAGRKGLKLTLQLLDGTRQDRKPLLSSPPRVLYVKHARFLEIKEEKRLLSLPEEFTSVMNDRAKPANTDLSSIFKTPPFCFFLLLKRS